MYVVDGLIAPTDPDNPPVGFLAPEQEMGDAAKTAIEAALAPLPVEWISFDRVAELTPASGAPVDPSFRAVLELSLPTLTGSGAQVFSALICGVQCIVGGSYALSRSDDGSWAVTGSIGSSFVS